MYIFKRHLKGFQLSADLGIFSQQQILFCKYLCVSQLKHSHCPSEADKRDSETKQRSLSLSVWSWRRGKICTWTNLSHTQMNAKHTHATDSDMISLPGVIVVGHYCFRKILLLIDSNYECHYKDWNTWFDGFFVVNQLNEFLHMDGWMAQICG